MKIVRRRDIPLRGSIYPYIRLYPDGLYFTVACVNLLQLQVNDYVTFLNDGKHWEFAKTTDTQEFRISKGNSNAGLWLISSGLAKMIVKSMDIRPNQRLYVRQTGRVLNDHSIISLYSTQPY